MRAAEKQLSRRQFLRGDFSARRPVLRPPWAQTETAFVESCDRCGECLSACGQKILVSGEGGYPEVDFSVAECTFCGDCARRCPTGALHREPNGAPWSLAARVGESCLAHRGVVCLVCGEQCEARAIRFPRALGREPAPEIDIALCTGCGACVASCPMRAITIHPQPQHVPSGVPLSEVSCK